MRPVMSKARHDPNGKVHIIRKALDRDGHIAVFKRDRTLDIWAYVDCVESETRPVRIANIVHSLVRLRRFMSVSVAHGSW
jgi:hypothetical protein